MAWAGHHTVRGGMGSHVEAIGVARAKSVFILGSPHYLQRTVKVPLHENEWQSSFCLYLVCGDQISHGAHTFLSTLIQTITHSPSINSNNLHKLIVYDFKKTKCMLFIPTALGNRLCYKLSDPKTCEKRHEFTNTDLSCAVYTGLPEQPFWYIMVSLISLRPLPSFSLPLLQ